MPQNPQNPRTPRNANNTNDPHTAGDPGEPAVDPRDAERQRQVKADHDAMAADARRVEATTPPEARDTPIGEMGKNGK